MLQKKEDALVKYLEDEKNETCSLFKDDSLLKDLQQCIKERTNEKVNIHGCSLVIDRDILFERNRSTLNKKGHGLAVGIAHCLLSNVESIVNNEMLDAIIIEGHASKTGMRGKSVSERQQINLIKSRERAENMYLLFVETIDNIRIPNVSLPLSRCLKNGLLSRLSSRSFGEHRPHRDSKCDGADTKLCKKDRRVEIVLMGSMSLEERNWKTEDCSIYMNK